ncbi:hypothetical protein E2320_009303 [Naja naja]|nr:hypothetical protein E2320_009303 [Naja naja]
MEDSRVCETGEEEVEDGQDEKVATNDGESPGDVQAQPGAPKDSKGHCGPEGASSPYSRESEKETAQCQEGTEVERGQGSRNDGVAPIRGGGHACRKRNP